MMAGFDLPIEAIREQIASAVNLIVQLKRMSDGSRKISYVTEIIGMEGDTIVTQPIFEYKQTGTDEKGKVQGAFQASGLIPKFVETLKAKGIALPKGLFSTGGVKSKEEPMGRPSSEVSERSPPTERTGARPPLSRTGNAPLRSGSSSRIPVRPPNGAKKK